MRVGILSNPPVGEVLTPYANSRALASTTMLSNPGSLTANQEPQADAAPMYYLELNTPCCSRWCGASLTWTSAECAGFEAIFFSEHHLTCGRLEIGTAAGIRYRLYVRCASSPRGVQSSPRAHHYRRPPPPCSPTASARRLRLHRRRSRRRADPQTQRSGRQADHVSPAGAR